MRVSYLTDQQVREQYLKLLDGISHLIWDKGLDKDTFWKALGYDIWEIPEL